MLVGVLLATFTAVTWGSISVLEARVSRALGGQSALAWVFGVGLVVILPIALLRGVPDASAGAWAWAMVAAVCSLAGLALMFTGLQYGRVGLVTATISVQGAFAAIYAAIGGESLHPLSVVAIAVSAIGTFVLMSGDGGAQAPPRERRGILLALAAACFTGLSLYAASRGGSGVGADWVLVCIRLSSVALVSLPLALTGRLRSPRGVITAHDRGGHRRGRCLRRLHRVVGSNRRRGAGSDRVPVRADRRGRRLDRSRRASRHTPAVGRRRGRGGSDRADDPSGLTRDSRSPLRLERRGRSPRRAS